MDVCMGAWEVQRLTSTTSECVCDRDRGTESERARVLVTEHEHMPRAPPNGRSFSLSYFRLFV